MFANTDLKRTLTAILGTLVLSTLSVTAAVGPARAAAVPSNAVVASSN